MGLTKTTVVLPTMLSPLGKACARMDLTAVHDILLKTGYKDEEGAENEVSKYIAVLLFGCLWIPYQYAVCAFSSWSPICGETPKRVILHVNILVTFYFILYSQLH